LTLQQLAVAALAIIAFLLMASLARAWRLREAPGAGGQQFGKFGEKESVVARIV
jgi:hypothetical protein